jgi:hypothetical protein
MIAGFATEQDGLVYYNIEGSSTRIPETELFFPMNNSTPSDDYSTLADAGDFQTADELAQEQTNDEQDIPGPLAVEPVRNLQLGYIDEYTDLMTRLTGAPREFNQLAGLVTVATVIQRRARLRMAFGDVYPNIYACIVARSSVYHKSSTIGKPRALFQRARLDKLLLSELFTSEGLLKQLQKQPAGVILRDEIGTLFSSHNTRYLQNLKPDLTAIYDCMPYSRILSAGEIQVERPYLNIFGATTPTRFYDAVTMTDWQDGFLARWLFVLPEGEPDFDAMTGLYTQEHDTKMGRLAAHLLQLAGRHDTDFIFTGDAHQRWDTWQRKAAREAYYFGDDVASAIVTRYSAYALKFAMSLAAVNDSWGEITPKTMQTAIHLADNYKGYMNRLLSEKREYGISGANLQKVFAIVQTKGNSTNKGVTVRQLAQYTKLKRDQITECIDKLLEIGAISEEKNNRTSRYCAIAKELPIKKWK